MTPASARLPLAVVEATTRIAADAAVELAKLARLNGTVESLENGLARIRLTGAWEAVHLQEGDTKRPIRGAATAEGFAVYDVKEQSIRSILILFSGIYGPPNDEAVCAAGAVVEWQR